MSKQFIITTADFDSLPYAPPEVITDKHSVIDAYQQFIYSNKIMKEQVGVTRVGSPALGFGLFEVEWEDGKELPEQFITDKHSAKLYTAALLYYGLQEVEEKLKPYLLQAFTYCPFDNILPDDDTFKEYVEVEGVEIGKELVDEIEQLGIVNVKALDYQCELIEEESEFIDAFDDE